MALADLERTLADQAETLKAQHTALASLPPALNAIAARLASIDKQLKKLDKLDKLDSIESLLVEIRDRL